MCRTIGQIEKQRFLSRRIQRQALHSIFDVPREIKCPECGHGYDIVMSRRQLLKGPVARRTYRYFHCRVCDCRFSRFNGRPFRNTARATISTATFFAFVILPAWLV